MKTILLATDFSNNAENAISYAVKFFREEPCDFLLIHAYKVDGYDQSSRLTPIPGAERMNAERERIEKQFKESIRKFSQLLKDGKGPGMISRFKTLAVNKPLVTAVQEILEKQNIELLVIGTQGHTGSSEVIYGSNTINLMEEIKRCPILAIPAHVSFFPPQELVLANSFKAELNPEDIQFLIGISRKFSAPIRVLHIAEDGGLSPEQKCNKDRLEKNFRQTNTIFSFHELEHLSIPLGIYAFSQSRGSDLIAFINKKHSLIENLLFDPLYRNLAHYSKVPVLVLHQP